MKQKLLALTLALALGLSLAACSDGDSGNGQGSAAPDTQSSVPMDSAAPETTPAGETTDSDLAYVQNKGTLVVGITEFEPMDYQDTDGNWIGFDADMAKAFAESLGVEVQFQLNSKAIDVVWNGMTLTDEVLSAMSCSNAYCNNTQVVVLPASVAADYPDAASMSGLNFAVESGSAGEEQAQINGFTCTPVLDQATAVLEVSSGTADAAIIDSLMAAAMVGEGTSYADLTYTIALNEEEGEQYGVGFRKGSDLVDALNQFFVDSYADGTMQALADTYGVQAALIPQE